MWIPLALVLGLMARSPVDAYDEANRLYEEGDYAGAISLYEEALDSVRDSRVLFNLGNAYFKMGRLGKAVLSYRRAWLLSPRDPDIRANLEFARSYRADKVNQEMNPLIALLTSFVRFFSAREASMAASVLFFICLALLSVATVRRDRRFGYAAAAVFVVFLYFFVCFAAWRITLGSRAAVVVVSEAKAYSGPGTEYREVLRIHDGLEVRIREARHGYVLVQVPGGLGGWVEESAVEEVVPSQKW